MVSPDDSGLCNLHGKLVASYGLQRRLCQLFWDNRSARGSWPRLHYCRSRRLTASGDGESSSGTQVLAQRRADRQTYSLSTPVRNYGDVFWSSCESQLFVGD